MQVAHIMYSQGQVRRCHTALGSVERSKMQGVYRTTCMSMHYLFASTSLSARVPL